MTRRAPLAQVATAKHSLKKRRAEFKEMNQKKVEAAREAETEAARKDKERIVCGRAGRKLRALSSEA